MYKWARGGQHIIRLEDEAYIPLDDANSDYLRVALWMQSGNEILPADPDPEPTPDQVFAAEMKRDAVIAVMASMTRAQVIAHIDSVFPNLNAAQRQVIVALALVARVVAKKL